MYMPTFSYIVMLKPDAHTTIIQVKYYTYQAYLNIIHRAIIPVLRLRTRYRLEKGEALNTGDNSLAKVN